MPERDGYISGVPCWVDTNQPDADAAAEFYSSLFGWELENVLPPDSEGRYFIARVRGGDAAAITGIPAGAPQQAAWNTYIWVDSVDDTATSVLEAGGSVLVEPFDVGPAGRSAAFADREGAAFRVWQPYEHRGAAVVNEPGAVVFNGLHARDRQAARAFYGAVFGWETIELGSGQAWRLPGYGDFLERTTDPDLRKRMAAGGAPTFFEDVVAALNPIAGVEAGVSAHWSVTFAVEDADATAELASALGGRVIVPPVDVPWSRMAVIADPQGARFTASKFVPENRDVGAPADTVVSAA